MEKDLISVVITTYNRKDYLVNAIESVLVQTYSNYEIIIVDDNSNDGTGEIIKKLYKDNNKIIYYKNEINKGPGINRKEAVDNKVNGEYIVFLDDDDIFLDNKYFEKAIKLFKKNSKLALVACNHIIYNAMTKEEIKKDLKYGEVVDNKEFFLNFGKEKFPKPICSFTIFRKEAFEITKYRKMKIFNDTTIFLRALLYGPMGIIDTYGGRYLIHGKNISFDCKLDFILDNLKEKYVVYHLAEKFFSFSREELKKWFIEQLDITIIYYIKGTKPTKRQMMKIYIWTIIYARDIKVVKKYINIYKENKKKEKQI